MNAYKVTVSAREVFQLMKKRREKILKQLLHISLKFVKELSPGLHCCWMWSVIYRKPRTSFNCWRRNSAYAFWSSFTLSPYEWFFPLKAFLSFEIASPLPSFPLLSHGEFHSPWYDARLGLRQHVLKSWTLWLQWPQWTESSKECCNSVSDQAIIW